MAPTTNTHKKRTRPVTSKGELRRREILDAAADLFGRLGYGNVSVEDIAEASGIGKATLYHYFKSREEILFAMHEVIAENLLDHAEEVAAADMPVREALRSCVTKMLWMIRDRPGYVRVFFEHYRELSRPLQKKIVVKRDRYATFIEDLVRRGIDTGECRPIDPHLTTLAIFGMTNWTHQWYRPSGDLTPEALADFFVDLLFQGLGADAESAARGTSRARRS